MQQARVRKGRSRLADGPSRIKSKSSKHVNVEDEKNADSDAYAYAYKSTSTFPADDSPNVSAEDGAGSSSEDEAGFGMEESEDAGEANERSLNSLLKTISKGSRPSRKKAMVAVSDDEDAYEYEYEYDGESVSSGDTSVDDDKDSEAGDDGDNDNDNASDLMDFDFDMEAKGSNPYLEHFSKEPLPEQDAAPNDKTAKRAGLKKLKFDSLAEKIVVQVSADLKQKYDPTTTTTTTTTTPPSEGQEDQDPNQNLDAIAMNCFSHVRKNIAPSWGRINAKAARKDADSAGKERTQPIFSQLQAVLYPMISNYCDAQITCMNRGNQAAIENMLVLHAMNHVLTANNNITMHNHRVREIENRDEDVDTEEFRDQGYTRPKVLILLPTRSTAYDFVHLMIDVLGENSSIENEEKFDAEFGPVAVDEEEDDEAEKRRRAIQKAKGKNWLELFGDGVNSDDDFKIGLNISSLKKKGKKQKEANMGTAVKLFSDFYHSDIIIASPLGLRMVTNNDDDESEEDGDIDFLSSIEVVIAHQSDVLLMQNWDHMGIIMDRLNQQPKKSTGIDFARVRNYLLSGQASKWRQTIMVSRFSDPHLISAFNRHSDSIVGKVKVRSKVPNDEASICNVLTEVRQVFQRVPCSSIANQGECRVKYFRDVILPQLIRTKQKHTLVYIPSYFDFISIRNIMMKNEIAQYHFVSVTEYARVSEVSRGRARFLQGRKRIMLYTGRAHFFMRHHIKGAKHLIMVGLPENEEFYPGLVNMLSNVSNDEDGDNISSPISCMNLFTKYDAQCLERIVGTKHSERMVKGNKSTILFNS